MTYRMQQTGKQINHTTMFTPTCQQPRANGTNILCVVAGLTHAAGARHTTHIAVHPSSLPPPLTPMWLYFLQMIGCLAYNQLPISAQTHINSTHSITHAQHTRLSTPLQSHLQRSCHHQSRAHTAAQQRPAVRGRQTVMPKQSSIHLVVGQQQQSRLPRSSSAGHDTSQDKTIQPGPSRAARAAA
jgi:hypothetical protein